jgi:hypothetical protein
MFLGMRVRFRATPAGRAGLVIVTEDCMPGRAKCTKRDVAMAVFTDPPVIYLVERALAFSRARLEGILLHEFGHLADKTPEAPGAERRADEIARVIGRKRVRYDRSDIQTTDRSAKPTRPAYLHQ